MGWRISIGGGSGKLTSAMVLSKTLIPTYPTAPAGSLGNFSFALEFADQQPSFVVDDVAGVISSFCQLRRNLRIIILCASVVAGLNS